MQRKKEREEVAEKIRKDLAEAHREYFEIVKLRKQDQQENYNRHRNLEQLNLKKTALTIQERMMRVEAFKH
jgi:DNA-binding transcriptional regulator WhiA